ncbi:MAG: hypothetical protein KC503_34855 [Myxococcales bacterium]|nr:hypothetical protein [Myxococcales bacterium]
MSEKPSADERLRRLEAELDADLLDADATSAREVDDELRAGGADPAEVRARSATFMQELLAQRSPEWRQTARARLERMRQAVTRASERIKRTRDEMIRYLERAQGDPVLQAPVVAAFRGRTPEDFSDDELAEIVDEVQGLKRLKRLEDEGEGE